MSKFSTVGLVAIAWMMGLAGQANADPVAKDNYFVQFTGSSGSKVHGSIVWTDARNPNKPTYMETVDGISAATIELKLPAGSIISATGSSDALKAVTLKIFRNWIECDDQPIEDRTLSSTKTCTPRSGDV
jgi:molybdopterin-binding protein